MRVPDKARRSVVFIGVMNNGTFIPKATGFLVFAYEPKSAFTYPYLVTAEHVISGLKTRGCEIYCRINLKDGSVITQKLPDFWWHHPNDGGLETDVAAIDFEVNYDTVDHEFLYLTFERAKVQNPSFGLGDEVFMIGLFKSHYGQERNSPILRLGTIAAMPEEPVFTKYCGFMDAYLIEVRSIAGLSGSPVFLNTQPLSSDPEDHPDKMYELDVIHTNGYLPRMEPGLEVKRRLEKRNPEDLDWFRYPFLGLVHGHFDVQNTSEDVVYDEGLRSAINTGIGVVVPASKIYETLYQVDLVSHRAKVEKERGAALRALPENA